MASIWSWPCPGNTTITSGVGPRWGKSHKGIDISAPKGAQVIATRDGKVTQASTACAHNYKKPIDTDSCGGGYGNHIYIDHGDGYTSRYAHLTQLNVKVGDTVKQGQVIGTVGSTGNSTGFHLHFEIRNGSQVLDPEQYVNPNNSVSYVNYDTPQAIVESAENYDYSGNQSDNSISQDDPAYSDIAGTTVGQRVSGVTPQPVFAFINIWLGDHLLSTDPERPNIIQSLEVDYLDDAGTEATFTVFDDNWEDLEYNLSLHWNDVYIQYGYYGTGKKSKRLKYFIQDYSLKYTGTGIILSAKAVSTEAIDNLTPISSQLDTYNPTEATKKICRDLGYAVYDENFDSSQDIHADNPFNLIEDYPLTYIVNTIIPQASQENEELFYFHVEYDEDIDNYVAYFKRKSFANAKTDSIRTYIYQKGYDSSVIDFYITFKGVLFDGEQGSHYLDKTVESTVIDKDSKSESKESMDVQRSFTETTGLISHALVNNSKRIVDASGYTESQMSNKLYYGVKTNVNRAYDGVLTIVGDPTIRLWSDGNQPYIRIIIVTDRGTLHHTSGVYMISKINHTITNGSMITSLDVSRSATPWDDISGIEILNPKFLIK